ncbi:MAG: hypothetical protein ACRCSN_04810 [Dermatophilaceae bacterium]
MDDETRQDTPINALTVRQAYEALAEIHTQRQPVRPWRWWQRCLAEAGFHLVLWAWIPALLLWDHVFGS